MSGENYFFNVISSRLLSMIRYKSWLKVPTGKASWEIGKRWVSWNLNSLGQPHDTGRYRILPRFHTSAICLSFPSHFSTSSLFPPLLFPSTPYFYVPSKSIISLSSLPLSFPFPPNLMPPPHSYFLSLSIPCLKMPYWKKVLMMLDHRTRSKRC